MRAAAAQIAIHSPSDDSKITISDIPLVSSFKSALNDIRVSHIVIFGRAGV
jgi:hypothetical protein